VSRAVDVSFYSRMNLVTGMQGGVCPSVSHESSEGTSAIDSWYSIIQCMVPGDMTLATAIFL
jgi:hypothetical protein